MKGISVIICCYNSAQRIAPTLKHLAYQCVQSTLPWEVILVDNCSTDNTIDKANEEWRKHNCRNIDFRILREPNIGLSFARETGAANAKHEIIIFCDDDNWLGENYISIAYNIIDQDPKIGAVGGRSVAKAEIDFPDWFQTWSLNYAVGKQWHTEGDASERKFLWGAGLVLRKTAFLKAFSEIPSLLFDRRGHELSSGGDSEICARLQLMGYKLYYSEKLRFLHFLDTKRLTTEYLKNLKEGQDKSWEVLKYYFNQISINRLNQLDKSKFFIINILNYLKLVLFNSEHQKEQIIINIFQLSGLIFGEIKEPIIMIKNFSIKHNTNH